MAVVFINGGVPSEPVVVSAPSSPSPMALPTRKQDVPIPVDAVRILNPLPVQQRVHGDFRPRRVTAPRTPSDYQDLRRELLNRN
jgi:hypothetical protein